MRDDTCTDLGAAWYGRDLRDPSTWRQPLTDEEVGELDDLARRLDADDAELSAITLADVPLPRLATRIGGWSDELADGRGFVYLTGLPVRDWTEREASLAYWALGLHLGVPVSQNTDGDLLGHVRDDGSDPADPTVRRYRTRLAQPFHTDGSDVVGLLCLHGARRGGVSQIASSVTIHDEVRARRPDLAHLLFEPWYFDTYGQLGADGPNAVPLPLATRTGARTELRYIRWYIDKAQDHAEVPRLTADQVALLDLIDALAADPEIHLDMDFAPGDLQLLSNSVIVHSRTAYEDFAEPHRRRHLLRLWLTLHRNAVTGQGSGGIPTRP